MAELKAVFFDVRGTLFDSRGCARQVIDIVLPMFAEHLPAEPEEIIHRFNVVLLDQVGGRHIRREAPLSRLKRFRALLDSYGVNKRRLAEDMNSKYDATRRLLLRQFLRDGSADVLAELGRRNVQRGAIMNGTPAVQRALVAALELDRFLDHVVLAEVEGYSKPDARLFQRALEIAGVRADEMLYVGDSPVADVMGASRAGIPVVWFNPDARRLPKGMPTPDFTIAGLGELLSVAEF